MVVLKCGLWEGVLSINKHSCMVIIRGLKIFIINCKFISWFYILNNNKIKILMKEEKEEKEEKEKEEKKTKER